MAVHIWIAWIALGICAVLGAVYAFVKWWQHIMIERDLEEFHKVFGPLSAKAEPDKDDTDDDNDGDGTPDKKDKE